MSATVQQPYSQHMAPSFQQTVNKWGNQTWDRSQIINPNYSSAFDPEVLCQNIIRDPRYNRLRIKWAPKLSDKGGLTQKIKNKFDPISIPYVGTVVAWKRAGELNQARDKLEKLQDANQDKPQQVMLDQMHNNAKVNQAGMTAKASAKTFFMFFPVVYALPFGDQMLSSAASKGASSAATKAAQKTSQAVADEGQADSSQADANESWGATKALLLYLGEPRNNDPIYHTWEDSRIQLKEFFGCLPEDDVWQMEPKDSVLKRIVDAEESQGGYDLSSINVPLLVLLWRIYDCWSEQYSDKVTSSKHKMNKQQRERAVDERQVLEMISPIDPHIQQLNETSTKEIVRLFSDQNSWGYGKHSIFSFLEDHAEAKREKKLGWMLKTFVSTLLKAQTGWGYFSDVTNTGKQGQLLAVLFFERSEQDHLDPSDLMKAFSGMMKLRTDYPQISKRLSWEDEIMQQNIGEEQRGILHFWGCLPDAQGQKALDILLRSQINYTSIPSYCQEYSGETERLRFLESLGFMRKTNLSQEQKDKLVFDSKKEDSPAMTILEYFPAARDQSAYDVPLTTQTPSFKNQA